MKKVIWGCGRAALISWTMSIHGKIEQIASGNKIAIGLEL